MFHFRLRPAHEIEPWGSPPCLHYFGLTDGCFWIQVGNEELFRYTPEVLACWESEAREQGGQVDAFGGVYDAYQVMRLHEDLDVVLPHALEIVPTEVALHVDTVAAWRRTAGAGPVPESVLRALAANDGRSLSPAEDMFCAATEWWGNRQMPVMHLRFSPVIHIWSEGEEVEVRWDNRHHLYKGIAVWTAQFGEVRMPRKSFIEAVWGFRQRFVEQMGERVQSVCQHWSRPDISIDLETLRRTQSEMEECLSRRHIGVASDTDWDAVRNVLERIVANR